MPVYRFTDTFTIDYLIVADNEDDALLLAHDTDHDLTQLEYADTECNGIATLHEYEARTIASEWHGGQGSALYAFTSSGHVDPDWIRRELRGCITDDPQEYARLTALAAYLDEHHPEPTDD